LHETLQDYLKKKGKKLEDIKDFDDLDNFKIHIGKIPDPKVKDPSDKQFNNLLLNKSIDQLKKKYAPSDLDLTNDFKTHFDNYEKNKENDDALKNLIPKDSIKVTLKISIDKDQISTIEINNFPISNPPGVKP
jgi:hypothetical protein